MLRIKRKELHLTKEEDKEGELLRILKVLFSAY